MTDPIAARFDALADRATELFAGLGRSLVLGDACPGRVEGARGDVTFRCRAWAGPGAALARAVRVDSDRARVFNAVVIPHVDDPRPVLGVELLAFARGLHLVVLDGFPLGASRRPGEPLADALTAAHSALVRPDADPIPEWGRAVFSSDVVLAKHRPDAPLDLERATAHTRAVLDAWHATGPASGDRDGIAQRRRRYLLDHAAHEPAGPWLARLLGDDRAHAFVHSVLFPSWLANDDEPRPAWYTPGA